jgi:hypothetical protein
MMDEKRIRAEISEFPKFYLTPGWKQKYTDSVPPLLEGRFAIVTDVRRDAMDAGGASDEGADLRTAKSCGPDAPTLASSFAEGNFRKATVANKPGHRGERAISR